MLLLVGASISLPADAAAESFVIAFAATLDRVAMPSGEALAAEPVAEAAITGRLVLSDNETRRDTQSAAARMVQPSRRLGLGLTDERAAKPISRQDFMQSAPHKGVEADLAETVANIEAQGDQYPVKAIVFHSEAGSTEEPLKFILTLKSLSVAGQQGTLGVQPTCGPFSACHASTSKAT